MERNRRTQLQGVVVSNKKNKTIVVEVETHKKHAKYAKRVKYSSKYYAHDENNVANVGDTVTIMACRPLSATKRWRLVSVDKKSLGDLKEEVKEVLAEEAAMEEAKVEEAKVEVKEEVKEEAPVKKAPAKKAPAKKEAAPKEKAPAKKTTKKAAKAEEEKGE